ncbi:hypothetical protein Efla_003083 [Eimeria flavescens]
MTAGLGATMHEAGDLHQWAAVHRGLCVKRLRKPNRLCHSLFYLRQCRIVKPTDIYFLILLAAVVLCLLKMCYQAACSNCGKTTWQGCGDHIDTCLKDVPMEDRCSCGGRPRTQAEREEKAKLPCVPDFWPAGEWMFGGRIARELCRRVASSGVEMSLLNGSSLSKRHPISSTSSPHDVLGNHSSGGEAISRPTTRRVPRYAADDEAAVGTLAVEVPAY